MLDFIISIFNLVSDFVFSFSEYFLYYIAFTAISLVTYLVYRRILRW